MNYVIGAVVFLVVVYFIVKATFPDKLEDLQDAVRAKVTLAWSKVRR